jgi:predicted DsbA family dithiol-disulfide isomerase
MVMGRADGGDRVLVSGAQPAAVLEGAVRRFAVEA